MKKGEITSLLKELLPPRYESLGFKRKRGLEFIRRVNDIWHIVDFFCTVRSGTAVVSSTLSLEIPELSHAMVNSLGRVMQLGVPLNTLVRGQYGAWAFDTPEALPICLDEILKEYLEFGEPYFQNFPTSGALYDFLSSDNAKARYSTVFNARNTILPLLGFVLKRREPMEIMEELDKRISECKSPLHVEARDFTSIKRFIEKNQ